MRDIARRLGLPRRVVATGGAAAATLMTVAALGAPSALAAGSVTVKSSYEQSPISLNTSDSIGYAITNSTGSTLTNFTFSDTLPAGVTLDDPTGLTNTAGSATSCGTTASVNPTTGATSAPGDSAVTITVASVPSASSGTICTVSLGVISATASVSDVADKDTLSSTFASPKPTLTAGSIVVLTNPVVSFTAPANNRTFKLGQISDASFACAATDPLDSVNSLFATDDVGNQVNSGSPIDTVDPGKHTLQVNCYSGAGGGDLTDTIGYKVGSYTLARVKADDENGRVSYKAAVPAGKFVTKVLDGKKVIGTTRSTIKSKRTATVTIKPTAAGRKLLAKADGKAIKVKLEVSFTPAAVGSGGTLIAAAAPIVVTRSLKLAIAVSK